MKIAVYIGRFQPFHYGHQEIINHLHIIGYDKILVLVGTPLELSDRDPIEPHFVVYSIHASICKEDLLQTLSIRQLQDNPSNDVWVNSIDKICLSQNFDAEFHLVIHNKPSEAGKYGLKPDQFISDFILENSRMITGSIDLSTLDTPQINATDIRNTMSDLLKLAPKQSLLNLLSSL